MPEFVDVDFGIAGLPPNDIGIGTDSFNENSLHFDGNLGGRDGQIYPPQEETGPDTSQPFGFGGLGNGPIPIDGRTRERNLGNPIRVDSASKSNSGEQTYTGLEVRRSRDNAKGSAVRISAPYAYSSPGVEEEPTYQPQEEMEEGFL